MKLLVENATWSLRLCLTVLRATSFWWPRNLSSRGKIIWRAFTAISFFFIVVINISTQIIELVFVFGDITRMTQITWVLITNIALLFKIVNIVWRMDKVQEIVDKMDAKLRSVDDEDGIYIITSSDQFSTRYMYTFTFLAICSVYGLAATVRKPEFPLPARFPYDTTTSPSYELTFGLQILSLKIAAIANVALDSLVASLISQCCCRLKLLALSLTKLCRDLDITENRMISEDGEQICLDRLRHCVTEHQSILINVKQIQDNFSIPVFTQLTVSSFIICVTAYQLAFTEKNAVLLLTLGAYITAMMMQVFMYCYHGNELSIESTKISNAAYDCLWYTCSTKIRRSLLILMIRSSREVKITVGGITVLSLATFMKVIKGSYSFFTVLQSTQE